MKLVPPSAATDTSKIYVPAGISLSSYPVSNTHGEQTLYYRMTAGWSRYYLDETGTKRSVGTPPNRSPVPLWELPEL